MYLHTFFLFLAVSASTLLLASSQYSSAEHGLDYIFNMEEVKHCGYVIRIPQLIFIPTKNRLIAYGQCRHSLDAMNGGSAPAPSLKDDLTKSQIVQKISDDDGKTWHNFSVVSCPSGAAGGGGGCDTSKLGFGSAGVIYDPARKRIVLQYIHFSHSSQTQGLLWYQRVSLDYGETYSEPRNMTDMIVGGCGHTGANGINEPVQNAGAKVCTSTGRYIFDARHEGKECVLYSDDGGASYTISNSTPWGNEVSLVEVRPGVIMMNGRGRAARPSLWPHRASYLSHDNGATWGQATKSPLMDNTDLAGCECGLMNNEPGSQDGALFFSYPMLPGRIHFEIWKSTNQGESWSKLSEFHYGGPTPGGYSALCQLNATHGFIVVETLHDKLISLTFAGRPFSYN